MVNDWDAVVAKLADQTVKDYLSRWRRRHARFLDDGDWSDLSTEAVARALRRHDETRRPFTGSLGYFLKKELLDHYDRSNRRRADRLAFDPPGREAAYDPDDLCRVTALMGEALPAQVGEVVRAYYLDGQTLEDIAARTGRTVDSVHQTVVNGVARLRQLVSEE